MAAADLNLRKSAKSLDQSDRDLSPHQLQEGGEKRGMRGPGGGGDEIAIHVRLIDGDLHVISPRQPDLGTARRVRRATATLENSGGRQELQAVADRRDRLMSRIELFDDFQHG